MQMKDQAICLRGVNYSETSQVVTLLSRDHGKIAAMAKGSRRPKNAFDGPIEIFSCGWIGFAPPRDANLATLTEFTQQPLFRGLRMNLKALNAAMLAAELTEKMTEDHDPHPPLYDALIRFLEDVQQSKHPAEILALLILYQLTLLSENGIRPVLDRCTNCPGKFSPNWKQFYFSSRNNGLVCPDCEAAFPEKKRITHESAAALADLKKLSQAPERTLKEIENLLLYHLTEILGKPPKCKINT